MDTNNDADELLKLLHELGGTYRVPSGLQPGLMTRVRFAGQDLVDQGRAEWRNARLLEQLQGFEPYVLCLPGKAGTRYLVTTPYGDPVPSTTDSD